jgi:hypothetical protein
MRNKNDTGRNGWYGYAAESDWRGKPERLFAAAVEAAGASIDHADIGRENQEGSRGIGGNALRRGRQVAGRDGEYSIHNTQFSMFK